MLPLNLVKEAIHEIENIRIPIAFKEVIGTPAFNALIKLNQFVMSVEQGEHEELVIDLDQMKEEPNPEE